MATKSSVPTDLIFQILCLSDPRDIIQWRTVSKVFNALTHETALWKTLYRNAPFPRPPGPFSTQSVASLQRTLHKAKRLAESWTTRPMRALSSLAIDSMIPRINAERPYTNPKLISGRWLVVFESEQRLVLHDVDPAAGKHTQQVLWEHEKPRISDWDVASIVSSEGHCVVYVLLKFCDFLGWKLLEFRLNYDTGDLLHSAIIDTSHVIDNFWSGKAQIYAGNSPLLFIAPAQTVFDTRTRIFYKKMLREAPFARFVRVIVSDTSLVAFSGLDYPTTRDLIPIYVFTLPPDSDGSETSPHDLCLTHKGLIRHIPLSNTKLLKHTIDPATGAMTISLLDYSEDLDPLELQCVEMTLPKCTPGAVTLPVDIVKRQIQLPWERVRLSRYGNYRKYVDISTDGQIRGFYAAYIYRRRLRPWETEENMLVMKFTIDTTQEPWSIARSQIAPAEWSREEDPRHAGEHIAFDGVRGRLCYSHPEVTSRLIVVDIE